MIKTTMLGKKGVHMAVAWVLLLGFTIALATTVFLWTTKQTESYTDSTVRFVESGMQCENVKINAVKNGENEPIDPTNLTCKSLNVSNTGYVSLSRVIVREICTEGDIKSKAPIEFSPLLNPKTEGVDKSNYTQTIKTFCSGGEGCPSCDKLEVMPLVEINKELTACKNKAVIIQC